ncbi:MAG TPA: hypothetical protein VF444_23110 [Pseudonocardiaceae bacterium]
MTIDLDLPLLPVSLAWHVRHGNDPAREWLRHQIQVVVAEGGDAD